MIAWMRRTPAIGIGTREIVAVERGRHRGEVLGEPCEHRGVAAPCGQSCRLGFECLPQLVEGGDVVGVHGCDLETATADRDDEPVGAEPGERLSHRRARHLEALRKLDLGEHGAGRQLPADDLVAEDAVRAVARPHRHLPHPVSSLCIHTIARIARLWRQFPSVYTELT